MLSLTFDEKALMAALAGQIDLDPIISSLSLPCTSTDFKCVAVGDHGYILSRDPRPEEAFLVISLQEDGPVASLPPSVRQETLGRILRCASRLITKRTRSIPASWRAYHSDNRLSFQADRYLRSETGGRTNSGRVILEITNDIGPRIFAFYLDREGRVNLGGFNVDENLLNSALSKVGKALLHVEEECLDTLGNSVSLDGNLPSIAYGKISYSDWYSSRLTKTQRQFVDYPLTGSARLVGPAGSGKTVALVVKCLKELYESSGKKYLFLTHASSTVNEIENLIVDMDENGVEYLASEKPSLVVTTLYALANMQMRYDLDELTPLSLDGYEGRTIQADILNTVIDEYRSGNWIAYKEKCSAPFVSYVESESTSTERRLFLWELLNEFACVLDAEGVRSGSERRGKYLAEGRKSWMMHLESREERMVVLELYDEFRRWLRDVKAIGSDQMIADFLNHLDSYRWEATRENEGYDVVFVDELHLFNRQERMTFRHLLRNQQLAPLVFMAYDAKQSPRDTFLSLPSSETVKYDYWNDARLGKVEKIELVDVFRYTPQIMKTLIAIDQSFPGQDLDDDWPNYKGIARTDPGPVPSVCEVHTTTASIGVVFKHAKNLQRCMVKGKRVAVLCCSNELFKNYLSAIEYKESYIEISSRDDASGIPHSKNRFIFSMPEYVAGLQFDTVILVEVNKNEIPDGPYSSSAKRKYVSQLYLGASRAERRLEFFCTSEHGGMSTIILQAVFDGVIEKKAVRELLDG